jgi:hypothetical protein
MYTKNEVDLYAEYSTILDSPGLGYLDESVCRDPSRQFFLLIATTSVVQWGGVAQLAARRLAVRQARVRVSARPHREVFPTEHTSDEDMDRGFSEWRRMNVL